MGAPQWNRAVVTTGGTFATYTSTSTQAKINSNPGGPSKLCLSCHDGTLALGNLNVINGQSNQTITMTNSTMPDGSGVSTGFTRDISRDLKNDHPISFKFTNSVETGKRLAELDSEIREPLDPDGSHLTKTSDITPLDSVNKVQCSTCHDPHVSGQDLPIGTSIGSTTTANNIKFLRTRRFQMATPQGGNFDQNNDIVCLACHDKLGTAWSSSVHADPSVANETYKTTAADDRQFPLNIQVWQASCLNCHDTHTVQGSTRLLREGTDSTATPKSGGNPALEETCFQCHTNTAASILNTGIANIKDEFSKSRRMPLTNYSGTAETHDIGDADFTEGSVPKAGSSDPNNALLGYGDLTKRHAECTDCHNPHRMSRNSLANKGAGNLTTQGTHKHANANHTNEISGVLNGVWGVEPVYDTGTNGRKFGVASGLPLTYTIKSGVGVNKVEFEYQICLKCHSDYAYADNGLPESSTRPALGGTGLTPSNASYKETNGFNYYTNQAMEFQAPSNHDCEPCSVGNDGGSAKNNNNHRSWHPVMAPTGRTTSARGGMAASNFIDPWDNNVGNQTMYCTDCHGAENGTTKNSEPGSAPWGPHGSNNNFLLRGQWTRGTGQDSSTSSGLCFKCHKQGSYNTGGSGQSGFKINGEGNNGHGDHGSNGFIEVDLVCTWCHVALPHGWKNKAFLVDINDIGPEVMCRQVDIDTPMA